MWIHTHVHPWSIPLVLSTLSFETVSRHYWSLPMELGWLMKGPLRLACLCFSGNGMPPAVCHHTPNQVLMPTYTLQPCQVWPHPHSPSSSCRTRTTSACCSVISSACLAKYALVTSTWGSSGGKW